MQGDGNLVFYGRNGARWASWTQNNPGAFAIVQSDNNFVVYAPNGRALWASNTWNSGGDRNTASVATQDDGNVVVYERSWGQAFAAWWTAPNCGRPSHCYSQYEARSNWYTGAFISQPTRYMTTVDSTTSNFHFITSEMWVICPNPDPGGNEWVEAGLVDGYMDDQPRSVYASFWADRGPDDYGRVVYFEHTIETVPIDNAVRSWQISRAATVNDWSIIYNNVPRGLSRNSRFWSTNLVNFGGEVFTSHPSAWTNTMDITARGFDSGGVPQLFAPVGVGSGSYIDASLPVGTLTPAGVIAINGASYSQSSWAWNKP